MNFFDLVNISERFIELVNPSTPEKVVRFGELMGLENGARVIDFGCGYAEPLVLWAETFGITGVGIDVRPHACERARQKLVARGLAGRIEIVCEDAAGYAFEPESFDIATCLGASFVWGGFGPAIRAMGQAIRPDGRLGLGEVYWSQPHVPDDVRQREPEIQYEHELLAAAREAGFDIAGIVRSTREDWDRYESGNWRGLLQWLAEHPDHPEWAEVRAHLDNIQAEYFRYGRPYFGWALYALARTGPSS